MKATMTRWVGLALLLLAACGTKTTPQSGGETNWLATCAEDANCHAGACICGVCSIDCSRDGECAGAFSGACVATDSRVGAELCGAPREAAGDGLCLPRCDDNADCGEGYACEQLTCVPRRQAPPDAGGPSDAGTAGGPSDSGILPPIDASSIPDAAVVELFAARLSLAWIYADQVSSATLYAPSCAGELVLEKRVGASWVPPRDDRPPSHRNPGYYLDGFFVEPSFNEGCDIVGCFEVQPSREVGQAFEFEQVGTMPPPTDPTVRWDGGVPSELPVIVSHPLEGELRVRLTYARDDRCADLEQTTAEITLEPGEVCRVACDHPPPPDVDAGL